MRNLLLLIDFVWINMEVMTVSVHNGIDTLRLLCMEIHHWELYSCVLRCWDRLPFYIDTLLTSIRRTVPLYASTGAVFPESVRHAILEHLNIYCCRSRIKVFSYLRQTLFPSMHKRYFGKVRTFASEAKCVPISVYGLECFSIRKADTKSLDFAVIRFFK